MRRLVYFSAVPWASFAQRPHKFVEWFHGSFGGDVLWVDPYPTRFPKLADIRRIRSDPGAFPAAVPHWLRVLRPLVLPIEPLRGSGIINSFFWKRIISEVASFEGDNELIVVAGKPSLLVLAVLDEFREATTVYDAMDDFPSFFDGVALKAAERTEFQLVQSVDHLWVSSTALFERWSRVRPDVCLVRNGLDPLLMPLRPARRVFGSKVVFGYVGTIADWFDWEWVIALARARPDDVIRLIGPIFSPYVHLLPENIEILPPLPHSDALLAMRGFDVALIPFRLTKLTASVDPIKYYEYRAMGLPVISTDFGEMSHRRQSEGTFVSTSISDVSTLADRALTFRDGGSSSEFVSANSWRARFDLVADQI